jgi:hypothetical protein
LGNTNCRQSNLKSGYSFILKTFKHITAFLVLSLLFKVSVSAGNVSFSKISVGNSVENQKVQSLSNVGMYLYIDTEAELVVGESQPDILPLSFDEDIRKSDGLLKRSKKLSLAVGCALQNYDRDFFNKSFTKEIIFPFHSFW